VTRQATELGPLTSRRQALLAARALAFSTAEERERLLEGAPLQRLRERLAHLAESLRYEEAARLRDRLEALERVIDRLRRLEELRELEACLIAPAVEPGWRKGFFVAGGEVRAVRSLPPGAGARLELAAGAAACVRPAERDPLTPEQAEELLLLDGFIRRPPPELTVLPLAEAARA
jgi:hypothetical protein